MTRAICVRDAPLLNECTHCRTIFESAPSARCGDGHPLCPQCGGSESRVADEHVARMVRRQNARLRCAT